MATFEPVPARVSFPALEADILAFWREQDIFRRSVEERPADRVFSFFEGPPTANGNPGIHHVLARVFKDLVPRYRTMRGDRVPRKGGWDTQGLPVELEVERKLGLRSKRDVEAYGIEAFNQQCRESVWQYVSEWERMTERIGFWVDMDDAYVTYSREYIETCWWIFKRLWDSGLMFRDYRVTPHCPRCETSLSSHEIALGYKEDTPDPSVTVLFEATEAASDTQREALHLADGLPTYVVAWTTTPWTLPGNVALAVHPEAEYMLVEQGSDHPSTGSVRYILAANRLQDVLPSPQTDANVVPSPEVWGTVNAVLARVKGSELVGLRYEPLFESRRWDNVEAAAFVDGRTQPLDAGDAAPARRVVAADFVATDNGTGIVHIAPAFGEDDYALGRAEDLLFLQPVGLDGRFVGGPWAGEFVKDADRGIRRALRERGLLLHDEQIQHTYPFCWRCDTPVLYYAKPSWYIRTTAVKDGRDGLIGGNERIHWVPDHIRDGRFGEWLANNIDWAVSRERYWGTPLPLWTCEQCGEVDCIGSYDELRERSGATSEIEDPHRPYIDALTLTCSACGGAMRRTPEVADAWFDSGAMPYAQYHYPFEHEDEFAQRFPADFICEAIDQTRGWFYTLHALATLLKRTEDVPESIAYRNVISLGHILDGNGQKMSKSKGNVVDPWSVLDVHGADALRWYLYTASPPGNSRRFSTELVGEVSRRFISTLWNTYSFFVTYASIANFEPRPSLRLPRSTGLRTGSGSGRTEVAYTELDRWVRSELHRTVQRVTEALDAYEPADAARPIGDFVEQLSNWYVRRSRRRFWKTDDSADTQAALHTLYECLTTVTRLLAPFTPFVSEVLYRNLVAGKVAGAPDSVHLDAWPEVDATAIDEQLSADVALVQRMVSLGRAARQQANARVRQPLAEAVLIPRTEAERNALQRLADQVADELNVKRVTVAMTDERLRYSLRPNLPVLGPRFGRDLGRVREAITAADAAQVAARMRAGEALGFAEFELAAGDLLVSVEATEGWSAAEEAGYVALVDTRVTPELEAEGMARELVRRLQDLRREAGLEVTDRIHVTWRGDDAVGKVFAKHGPTIAEEVLALSLDAGDGNGAAPGGASTEADIEGHAVVLALEKA